MFWTLFQTFVRSFLLQTLWNFERMQNIGFAFSITPLLKSLGRSREAFEKLLRRQLDFFNIHPYFAPLAMGVVYAREKARAEPEKEDPTLAVLKDSIGGAFGAVGDHVIWGTWRPFCAVLAMSVGLLAAKPTHSESFCAEIWIAGFLLLFNSVHFWLRWYGLKNAVQKGPLVVRWVESLHLQTWAAQVRRTGLLLWLALALIALGRWSSSSLVLPMVGVLLGTLVLKRWAVSGFLIFYLVCTLAIAAEFLGIR